MRKKCKSCNGIFSQDQNTHAYFHTCSPSLSLTSRKYEERADKRDENPVETMTVDEWMKLEEKDRKTTPRVKAKLEGKGSENI